MEVYGIDVVLDVGANAGQFAAQLRKDTGYSGRIVSFEPQQSAFAALEQNAKNDAKWTVLNYALGDQIAQRGIHIAGNSFSSSLLEMLPAHLEAAPESKYVGQESVAIKTLDSIFPEFCTPDDHDYLKIDTQGFEYNVIQGAERSLPSIGTLQLELSLVPLYQNEMVYLEMCTFLQTKGYHLVAVEEGLSNSQTGELLQMDGIFHRP